MDARLNQLLDKQAITEALYLYCRAMDRLDRALGRGIWHPDGTASYGDIFQGLGADFVEQACDYHATLAAHSHQVTNILIVVEADHAVSEAYLSVTLRLKQDGELVERHSSGRYLDNWSKRDGRWRIDHRDFILDCTSTACVHPDQRTPWAARDRSDPSYVTAIAGLGASTTV